MSFDQGVAVALSLIAGVALAAAAGLRAFLPLLVLSAAARLGLVHLHEGVAFLESDVALIALVVGAIVEILGDKIPLVDHALDVAGTVVRPGVGFLAGMAVLADLPGPVTVILSLFLAMMTLGTHLGHAKTRVGSTALTAGVGNPILSFLEDMIALALSVLAVVAPLLALAMLIFGGYLFWRILRRLRRRPRRPSSPPAV